MKRILYFFPENPLERNAGNKTRALQLLSYFRDRQIEVDFMSTDQWLSQWSPRDMEEFRQSGLASNIWLMEKKPGKTDVLSYFLDYKIHQIAYKKKFNKAHIGMHSHTTWHSTRTFQDLVRRNNYDCIIISYIYWAELIHNIRAVSNAKTIIDTHDFMTSQARQNEKFRLGDFFEEEIRRLNMFDEIWTVSVDEQYLFSRFCTPEARWVPLMQEAPSALQPYDTWLTSGMEGYDMIYVASDNPHNLASADWFFKKVYPRLPDNLRLCVVGKIAGHIADYINVTKVPFAENLGDYYRRSKLALCPILSGTGTKVKVIEALSYGLPVVCTPRGIDGLPDKIDNGCLVYEQPEEYARGIVELLENARFYREQSELATEMFLRHFEKNACYQKLDELFGVQVSR